MTQTWTYKLNLICSVLLRLSEIRQKVVSFLIDGSSEAFAASYVKISIILFTKDTCRPLRLWGHKKNTLSISKYLFKN